MNFLGHAYIARNHTHLIAGNFAGDSYKGNLDNFDLPKNIIDGVKLHRFIDSYTDQSAHIIEASHLFQAAGISKITYIGIDILLDHFLAREWKHYSTKEYSDFVDIIYQHTDNELALLDQEFRGMYSALKTYGWLFDYSKSEGIRKILNQFSNRVGFDNDLQKCLDVYLKFQTQFDELFRAFLIDINRESVEFIRNL